VPSGHTVEVPELLEVEAYRSAADAVVGRRIRAVDAPDDWYLKGGLTPSAAAGHLAGRRVAAARRHGKVLLVDTDGPTIGIRFGMTGRLLVDGRGPIDGLEYGPDRDDPTWHRFALDFGRGRTLVVTDPRRLGGVELDPDLGRLGPDAAGLTLAQLRRGLAGARAPVKAVLLDQHRVAGLGNLLVDEVLYRAGLDPARPGRSLDDAELRRLHRSVRRGLAELGERGGSHLGDLPAAARRAGALCPLDGTPLVRRSIAGRTTWSCPSHQR
jgi:formamidopyrimidine-DNA glycosylase